MLWLYNKLRERKINLVFIYLKIICNFCINYSIIKRVTVLLNSFINIKF